VVNRWNGVEWNLPTVPITKNRYCRAFKVGYTTFSKTASNKSDSDEEFADIDIRRNAVELLDDGRVNFRKDNLNCRSDRR